MLLLASCGAVQQVPVLEPVKLPDTFATCKGRPTVPDVLDDKAAAGLLLDYDDAWSDCHDKLQRAWTLTQTPPKQ
jgi:hypothetical protein